MTLLEQGSETPRPTPPTGRRASLRPLLTRLHFYAGVLVAPFIFVAALSGALYAISPQLEAWVHHDELTTDSRGEALSIDAQVDAARTVQPDLPLLAVRPATEEGATTRVLLDDGRTEQFRRLAVFVDPVDGEVQGQLTSYGGSGALPVRTWIDELHRNLLLGEPGRLYSELAASWLWVVALAGLTLWWTGRRRTTSRWRPDRSTIGRRRTLSWHGALGTWLVLGMLMLSVTGLTWSRFAGANVTELRTALDWNSPTVVSDLAAEDEAGGGHGGHTDDAHEEHGGDAGQVEDGTGQPLGDSPGVGYQQAEVIARGEGLTGPVEITGPTSRSTTYVVQELDTSWPTRADVVSVDQAGRVVDVVRFADWPFVAKLASWGIDLHMGVLFGLPNQLALLALAVGIMTMTVLGYRMWWQRRPTRGDRTGLRRVGRPARRGTWRQLHPAALGGIALVAVLVGWFLPLWGLSLLAFLLVDAMLAWRARRRSPAPSS